MSESKQFWLSFRDPEKETGKSFLGVCIVEADDLTGAIKKSHRLGINPGGEIASCEVSEMPEEVMNSLLSKEQLSALGLT